MALITVARQLGAGGAAVADALAERLGWRLLDRGLVDRIAEDLQVAPEQVELNDERVAHFMERLGLYLSEVYPEVLSVPAVSVPSCSPELTARAARRVVAAAASEGSAVVVGHGAQFVLAEQPDALHVLVHASLDFRVARAAGRWGVTPDEARERIRRSDDDRRAYIRAHFGGDWLDPRLYGVCIDTGRLGLEGAVETIAEAARRCLPAGAG